MRTGKRTGLAALLIAALASAPASADEKAEQLLAAMSTAIAELDAFVVSGDAYADARLPEGLIIEHASMVTLRVLRPASLRLTNVAADGSKEIYFNDGTFSVSTQPRNFYAQTEIPASIEAAAEYAVEELEVDAPLLDLVMKDVAGSLRDEDSTTRYLGESLVRGERYHQLVIRGPEVDVQLWLAMEGPPLPGKIAISAKFDGGAPRSVGFLSWDTDPELPSGSLDFVPAADAVQIPMMRDLDAKGE
ncbi:MAG: DUF2092 domain-containing protein [Pseudomonadota bacterium]